MRPSKKADNRGLGNLARTVWEGGALSDARDAFPDALRAVGECSSPLRYSTNKRRPPRGGSPFVGADNRGLGNLARTVWGRGALSDARDAFPDALRAIGEGSRLCAIVRTKGDPREGDRLLLVPITGLEPVRDCSHRILSPRRLPVPPYRLVFKYNIVGGICQVKVDFRFKICYTVFWRSMGNTLEAAL